MTQSVASADAIPRHPSGIHPRIVAKVFRRRGRLHAYEGLDGTTTALVVVDMVDGLVANDGNCAAIVPAINALARAVRLAGGAVAWVRPAATAPDRRLTAIVGAERAALFSQQSQPDDPRARLHERLDVASSDIRADKVGASAFFPGKCDLHGVLEARGIETVLIAGTVTNVCCESSARDAAELGYRVVMVSDALAGHAFGLHEASLATFYRIFGDVRPTAEIVQLLGETT
ncbi:MAG: cysteine hydrolase [Pseudomonadota bacterium]